MRVCHVFASVVDAGGPQSGFQDFHWQIFLVGGCGYPALLEEVAQFIFESADCLHLGLGRLPHIRVANFVGLCWGSLVDDI